MEKIKVTKNYSYSFRPHAPKCDNCEIGTGKKGGESIHRCSECREIRKRNESKLRFCLFAAHRMINDIKSVRKEWKELWDEKCKIEFAECNELKESDPKRSKALEKAGRETMTDWIRGVSPDIKSEIISAVDWYYDHPAFSNYVRTDVISRCSGKINDDIEFKRFDGSGSLYIQIPGGMKSRAIESRKMGNGFRVAELGRRKKVRTLRIKVAEGQGLPIYTDIDVVMHRDLPEGSLVKGIRLISRKIGLKLKYSIVFSIECEVGLPKPEVSSWAAVKIGWSEESGAATAMKILDSSGGEDEICIDVSETAAIEEKMSRLKKEIDDVLVPQAIELIASSNKDGWPEWLVKKSENARLWKSEYRVIELLRAAKSVGINLCDYERLIQCVSSRANASRNLANKRKDRGNKIASDLKKKYEAVCIPDTDYKKMKEKKSEDKYVKKERERNTMTAISPGVLRERLESKFGFNAFRVSLCEKKLGADTLHFMAARAEMLAKGPGVLANVKKQLDALEKRRVTAENRAKGRAEKMAARKDAELSNKLLD